MKAETRQATKEHDEKTHYDPGKAIAFLPSVVLL